MKFKIKSEVFEREIGSLVVSDCYDTHHIEFKILDVDNPVFVSIIVTEDSLTVIKNTVLVESYKK